MGAINRYSQNGHLTLVKLISETRPYVGGIEKRYYFFLQVQDVNLKDEGLEECYTETENEASVEERRPERGRETES